MPPKKPLEITPEETRKRLEKELGEVQEMLSTVVFQASSIEANLEKLGSPVEPPADGEARNTPHISVYFPFYCKDAKCSCLPSLSSPEKDICARLLRATFDLINERKKHQETQRLLDDVQRECAHPSVIPMLEGLMIKMQSHSTGFSLP